MQFLSRGVPLSSNDDRPTPAFPVSPRPPFHTRRRGDSGFRALLQPKVLIGGFLLVAGWGFTAGKWVGTGEHSDKTLSAQIKQVDQKVTAGTAAITQTLDGRLSTEELDKRYVTKEMYQNDVAWIKDALKRIEAAENRRVR